MFLYAKTDQAVDAGLASFPVTGMTTGHALFLRNFAKLFIRNYERIMYSIAPDM